jgi:LCP family protein required for cell wall assembly
MPDKPSAAPTQPRRTRSTASKVGLGLVAVVAVVAIIAVGMGFWSYRQLNANITTVDPSASNALGTARPEKENEAINLLAIGSDSRTGENSFVGGESPGLADTTLVVHIAADNSWATAVSIPRDSMVQMPECLTPEGKTHPAGFRQFNEAYMIGGPLCVQRTVESLTNLPIDHFVEVDFTGFRDMVDAVGGVTVYVPKPISDPHSKIYFEAGCQTLKGNKALQYVRVRHGVDDGSDTARIKRQQAFLISLIQKVTSAGMLTNPIELYKFLDAATKAVTTDTGLGGVDKMVPLALRVRELGLDSIEFLTVPVVSWPQNPNRLIWQQPDADKLWTHLREDQPLSPKQTASASGSAPSSPSPAKSKSQAQPTKSPSPSSSYDSSQADTTICPQE